MYGLTYALIHDFGFQLRFLVAVSTAPPSAIEANNCHLTDNTEIAMYLRTSFRLHLVLLLLFVLVNLALFSLATYHTLDGNTLSVTFTHADDGQKYWGVATALVDSGSFLIPQEELTPLAKAGPLTPMVFAIFIKLAGLHSAAPLIIAFQCGLLFCMGLFAHNMAREFGAPAYLVQGLVIFNPNLVGLAHYAQSDILFAFLFTSFCWIASCKLLQRSHIDRKWFLLLGLALGMMMLTRDVGKVFAILIVPTVFLFLYFGQRIPRLDSRTILLSLLITSVTAAAIYSPWVARNYTVFGSPTATSSVTQLRENYAVLISRKDGISHEQINHKTLGDQSRLSPFEYGGGCRESQPLVNCFIEAVFEEEISTIAMGILSAWSGTFLAGGATRLAIYLGFSGGLQSFYTGYDSYVSIKEYPRFLSTLSNSEHKEYIFLVLLTAGFVLLTRLAGLVGLLFLLRKTSHLPKLLFFLTCIAFLLAMYMFFGVSRFRAPFEPILMLFAGVGLNLVRIQIQKFPYSSR